MSSRGAIAIRLKDVELRYQAKRSLFRSAVGSYPALRGITMDLQHGEKLGVIGRNGAGKSSLLRVLAGALKPDAGTVQRNHGRCRLLALGSGFMQQLSGRENAVLSGLILGMPRRKILSRLDEIEQFSELGEFFDQPVKTYSSGMRSRLGFAIAIQQEPDILLIDETLTVGDSGFRKKSKKALREKMKEGSTVVIVSHNKSVISNYCDRAIWVEGGRVLGTGDPEEILRSYESST